MSLFELNPTFKTKELIKDFREVSAMQMERFKNLGPHFPLSECTASFSFGRQAGHTTATAEIAYEDMVRGETTLIITHNYHMTRLYVDLLQDYNNLEIHHANNQIFHATRRGECQIISSGVSMAPERIRAKEFDHVMIDIGSFHFNKWREIVNSIPKKSVKDIVSIG